VNGENSRDLGENSRDLGENYSSGTITCDCTRGHTVLAPAIQYKAHS
jgi:hypothetical protein